MLGTHIVDIKSPNHLKDGGPDAFLMMASNTCDLLFCCLSIFYVILRLK